MEDNAAPIRRKKLPGKLLQLLQLLPGGKPTTITIIYTFVTQHVMWQKKDYCPNLIQMRPKNICCPVPVKFSQ